MCVIEWQSEFLRRGAITIGVCRFVRGFEITQFGSVAYPLMTVTVDYDVAFGTGLQL